MTQHDDDRLAAWLADGPQQGSRTGLEQAFEATRTSGQRPAWLVSLTGGTIAAERTNASLQLTWVLIAVVALMTLLAGTVVVGGWLNPQPPPSVVLPDASSPPTTSGLVAYTVVDVLQPGEGICGEARQSPCPISSLWVANADGSGAHELFPGRRERDLHVIAWSPDGSRLLHEDAFGLMLTDPSGSESQRLAYDTMCRYPCAGMEGFAFSPDGTMLAFVRNSPDADNASVVALMDLATGQVTELESTRTTNPAPEASCGLCQGHNDAPRWSPDGDHLAFARQGINLPNGDGSVRSALFIVDVDGSNFHQVGTFDLYAVDPEWSPDGSVLTFLSAGERTEGEPGSGTDIVFEVDDIYTVRADGTDLRRLTDDGVSLRANWTRDGRLVFARIIQQDLDGAAYELWVMDSDGGNQTRLDASDFGQLTAVGCVTCPYPQSSPGSLYDAVWQPATP